MRYNSIAQKPNRKGLAAIYRQEIIRDIALFTSQGAASFYDKLFASLDFELPRAKTGRTGFPKEAMLCAVIVMKCEGFGYITDLRDYLDNNRLIAHYCGFDITKPLPSYWTFERFIKETNNGDLKGVMASLVRKLYDLGVVDASFIGLDSTPNMANTAQNNPKSFQKNKFSKDNHPKADPDCALGVHTASNQHNEKNYEFYWGYKNHILVDCISGLPLYELTTPANVHDASVTEDILAGAKAVLPIDECTFIDDKAYDEKHVYSTVRELYHGDAVIPLNKRNTKDPAKKSKSGQCPCNHRNWNNGKKNRGCTKYKAIPDDYRLSIDRECLRFKRVYALRSGCERYNSRFKATGQERLWIRNANSAANLNTIAHITALAAAFAAVMNNSRHSYRSAKALRRAG